VHGASASFHLANKGAKTVVFERDRPAAGPTGRSSAVVRTWYSNEFLAQAAFDSLEVFENFGDVTGGRDASFHRTGVVFMHPVEDLPALEKAAAFLRSIGNEVEILDLDQLATMFPSFNPGEVAGGAYEPNGGHADPAGTTLGFLERAIELGVASRVGSGSVSIKPLKGGGAAVVSPDGKTTTCDKLLIAAGPWTNGLAKQCGADIPLTVERHIIGSYGWGSAEPVPFVYADVPNGIYAKPDGHELYIVGELDNCPEVNPDDYPEEISDDEAAELAGAVIDRIPHLEDSEHRGGWASLYDMSPDWQPVIGEIADGVFVDCGTAGHGFKLAPALTKHIVDLVMGLETDPGLDQFHPRRFEEGRDLSSDFARARILG
jgi:sarcosine oxidase subunit beta